jgi:hypothetical protein
MNLFFITMLMLLINNCNAKANEAKNGLTQNQLPYGLSKDSKTFFGKQVDAKVSFFLAIAFPKYKPTQEASAPSNQDWLDKLKTLENALQGTQVIKQWIETLRKKIRDEPTTADKQHLLEITVPFLYFLLKAKNKQSDDDVDGMEEVTDISKSHVNHQLDLFKFNNDKLYFQENKKYWLDKLEALKTDLQDIDVLNEWMNNMRNFINLQNTTTEEISKDIPQIIKFLSQLSKVKKNDNDTDITDMQEVTRDNIFPIPQDAVFKFNKNKLYFKERTQAPQDESTKAKDTLTKMGFAKFYNHLDECMKGKTGAELDNEMNKADGMVAEIVSAPNNINQANKINSEHGNKNTNIHLIKIKNNDELIEIYTNLPKDTDGTYAFPHFVNDF